MTYLFHEAARQHAANTKTLFDQRRSSRIAVVAIVYLLVAVGGVFSAALVANNPLGDAALVAAAVAAALLFFALLVSRRRIRRIEKSMDQSLDVIAATRATAHQAGIPANEQEQLHELFFELQDRRARGLLGEKRTLF